MSRNQKRCLAWTLITVPIIGTLIAWFATHTPDENLALLIAIGVLVSLGGGGLILYHLDTPGEWQWLEEERKADRTAGGVPTEQRNGWTFAGVIAEFSKLNLTPAEIEEIRQQATTTYSDQYGYWDADSGMWAFNQRAVRDAARCVDTVFVKMLASIARPEGESRDP